MEKKLRSKFPLIKSMHDLPKLGAFITFNHTKQLEKCIEFHSSVI